MGDLSNLAELVDRLQTVEFLVNDLNRRHESMESDFMSLKSGMDDYIHSIAYSLNDLLERIERLESIVLDSTETPNKKGA